MKRIGARFIILIHIPSVVECGGGSEGYSKRSVERNGGIANLEINVVNIGEIILLSYHPITPIIGTETSYKDIDL